MDDIYVNPGEGENKVSVATDEIDNIHHPEYKIEFGAKGTATPVDADNPLPVSVAEEDITHTTDVVTMLAEISRKLSILIKYESMLHKIELIDPEEEL